VCACKRRQGGKKIHVKAVTRVVDPHYKPRRTRHIKRKFVPTATEPNPIPSIRHDVQCRPNIARIGPGNCRRGNSMGVCATRESGCKSDQDAASTGFIAAKLTTDIDPSDEPEDCDGKLSKNDAEAISAPSKEGHVAKVAVEVYNRCTKKTHAIPAQDVHVESPLVIRKNQNGDIVSMESLSGSGILGAPQSSVEEQMPASMAAVAQSQSSVASMGGIAPPFSSQSSISKADVQSMIKSAVSKALSSSSKSKKGSKSSSSKSDKKKEGTASTSKKKL